MITNIKHQQYHHQQHNVMAKTKRVSLSTLKHDYSIITNNTNIITTTVSSYTGDTT